MKNFKKIVVLTLLLSTVACQYPSREVSAGGQASTIEFLGEVDGASLTVNGVELGQINKLIGKNEKLEIPSGANQIVVYKNGAVVYEAKIFLSAGQAKQIVLQ